MVAGYNYLPDLYRKIIDVVIKVEIDFTQFHIEVTILGFVNVRWL